MATYGVVLLLTTALACGSVEEDTNLDLARARNAMDMARYDWARHYFAADLETHPARAESLRGLGVGWVSGYQGSLSHAIEAFESYLDLVPNDDEVGLRLAKALRQMGDNERALDIARGLEPSAEQRLLLAQILESDRPEAALEQLESILEATPGRFEALHLSARILAGLGREDLALHRAQQAVDADSLSAAAVYQLASLQRRLGRTEEAATSLAAYETLQELSSPDLPPIRELELLREVERRSGSSELLLRRRIARVLLETGQASAAAQLVDKIVNDPECDAECLLLLAQTAHTERQTALARDLYDRSLERVPDHAKALDQSARLAYESQDFAAARQLLDRGFSLYPDRAPLHFTAGLLALSEGDEPQAMAALTRAVELVPWLARYRLTLADVLLTRGDRTAAARLVAAAPAADPEVESYRKRHGL